VGKLTHIRDEIPGALEEIEQMMKLKGSDLLLEDKSR